MRSDRRCASRLDGLIEAAVFAFALGVLMAGLWDAFPAQMRIEEAAATEARLAHTAAERSRWDQDHALSIAHGAGR